MDSKKVSVSSISLGLEIVASDWNNRIRDTTMKISSKIPEVGAAVSILIGFFWPENKIDIFESLKKDLTNLVKKEILDYELNLHKSEIDALKITMKRYEAAQIHEKAGLLTNWITEADKLSVIFRQSTNNIHLILLDITLALLHLTGLRERLLFGKKIYEEDNTRQWKEDLDNMYKTYIADFLPDIFRKWKLWRADQVKISTWTQNPPPTFLFDSYARVVDTITGETKNFSVDLTNSETVFKTICEAHKTRMCNDAFADMAGCMSTTFVFDKLLPNNEENFPKYDKEVFGRMFRGPYSQDLFLSDRKFGLGYNVPIFRTNPDHDDYRPNSGPLRKVIIREWNSIDAMQFIYANRKGELAGNAVGGQSHDIDVTGKPINGLRMGFSSGVLALVQIIYSDGTSSPTYGNRRGWNCDEVSTNGPSNYRVSSWSYKVDRGPSNSYGPSVIQLEYTPQIE